HAVLLGHLEPKRRGIEMPRFRYVVRREPGVGVAVSEHRIPPDYEPIWHLVSRVRNSPAGCGSGGRCPRQGARPGAVTPFPMRSSSCHPFLCPGPRTGTFGVPATICSTNL